MTGLAPTTVVERPPPGLARGSVPAPLWLVVLLSAALVCVAIVVLVRAWRRRQK